MQLTKENMNVFAAKYYDNPFCLTEDEFKSDVFKSSIIKKMLTAYSLEKTVNLQTIVNTTIGFYNVFDHKAASLMLSYRVNEEHIPMMNSILFYLSYPLIGDIECDTEFLLKIRDLYK